MCSVTYRIWAHVAAVFDFEPVRCDGLVDPFPYALSLTSVGQGHRCVKRPCKERTLKTVARIFCAIVPNSPQAANFRNSVPCTSRNALHCGRDMEYFIPKRSLIVRETRRVVHALQRLLGRHVDADFKEPRIVDRRLQLRDKKAITEVLLHCKHVSVVVLAIWYLLVAMQKFECSYVVSGGIRTRIVR